MVVAAGQVAGKGGEVSEGTLVVVDNEHSEHLALLEFGMPVGAALQVGLYFFSRQDAERMRRVVERIGELFRQRNRRDIGLKRVNFAHFIKKCARNVGILAYFTYFCVLKFQMTDKFSKKIEYGKISYQFVCGF